MARVTRRATPAAMNTRIAARREATRFLTRVKAGNADKVQAMLRANPALLYVEDAGRISPVLWALDKNHKELVDFLVGECLRRLRQRRVPRQHLTRVMHDLGEVGLETGFKEAEPHLARYLWHRDPLLRWEAVMDLGLHFKSTTYRREFERLARQDRDVDVRRIAASALGFVLQGTRDRRAVQLLLGRLRDKAEDASVREASYEALIELWFSPPVSERHLRRFRTCMKPEPEGTLERCADWRLLNTIQRALVQRSPR